MRLLTIVEATPATGLGRLARCLAVAEALREQGHEVLLAGEVDLIVNTPFGNSGRLDGYEIRTAAVTRGIPCLTTVQALGAAVQGIEAVRGGDVGVAPLQEHHALIVAARATRETGR